MVQCVASDTTVLEDAAMATNLHIDQQLLEEAVRLSGKKTKREVVNDALAEYVRARRQREVLEIFGEIDFDPGYDHKNQRSRR